MNAMANVISFAMVEEAGQINYVQCTSSFLVSINERKYVFKKLKSGRGRKLYACDMRKYCHGRSGIVCVTTVLPQ